MSKALKRRKRFEKESSNSKARVPLIPHDKLRDVFAVIFAAFSGYLALALLTQWGGLVGGGLRSFLLTWFGEGSYSVIFIPLFAGILLRDVSRKPVWLHFLYLLMWLFGATFFFDLIGKGGNSLLFTAPLFRFFGKGGTVVFVGTLLIVTTLLLTGVSLIHFGKIGKILISLVQRIFQLFPRSLPLLVPGNREYEPDVAESPILREIVPVKEELRSSSPEAETEEESEELSVEVHLASESHGGESSGLKTGGEAPPLSSKRIKGQVRNGYQLPGTDLLEEADPKREQELRIEPSDFSPLLEETLRSFGVEASVLHVERGPTVTRYELQPARGVKVSKILSLSDDIALALAASSLRIEAPIPGKSAIGIEVPNSSVAMVYFKDLLATRFYQENSQKMILALGKDITGQPIFTDLKRMPHLLIAGATGSGKTVCINTLIASILCKATPLEVQFIMIDPKRVELTIYDGIPHLIQEVVTDPKLAAKVLMDILVIMDRRYSMFKEVRVRNVEEYNRARVETPLPYIIVLIDELADLMMLAAAMVESSISRLAALARAAGIHLIVATQRPSVDVITGIIKANIPSRVAFAVSSIADSRTILDTGGAEKLLGRGDMLFAPIDAMKPVRLQGAFVSLNEIEALVRFWQEQPPPENLERLPEASEIVEEKESGDSEDELYSQAKEIILRTGQASVSTLQRKLKVGYARAGRLMDILERRGIVGPADGSKPRKILIQNPYRSSVHEF